MSAGISFRDIGPGDLPAMQAIRAAAFAPVFASFRRLVGDDIAAYAFTRSDPEQADMLDQLCRPESGHSVLVACRGERVVGFITYSLDAATGIGEIGLNAVDPAAAGQGIGTAMCEHVLALMKLQGAILATVGTGGDESHAAARRAYEKAGFGNPVPSLWLYRRL